MLQYLYKIVLVSTQYLQVALQTAWLSVAKFVPPLKKTNIAYSVELHFKLHWDKYTGNSKHCAAGSVKAERQEVIKTSQHLFREHLKSMASCPHSDQSDILTFTSNFSYGENRAMICEATGWIPRQFLHCKYTKNSQKSHRANGQSSMIQSMWADKITVL